MTGVVKVNDPLTRADPPTAEVYQSIVSPAPAVADIFRVPLPQREAPEPAGVAGTAFTVAVTGVRVFERHPVLMFLACA